MRCLFSFFMLMGWIKKRNSLLGIYVIVKRQFQGIKRLIMFKKIKSILAFGNDNIPYFIRRIANTFFKTLNQSYYVLYGHKKEKIDAITISFPKSGRTWLRYILANYYNLVFGTELSLNLDAVAEDGACKIKFTHDLNHLNFHKDKKLIVLLRNPKDVIVSHYHHIVERAMRFKGNFGDFVKSKKYGFKNLLRYYDCLEEKIENRNRIIIHYESMKENDFNEVERIIDFLGVKKDVISIKKACESSKFDRMRQVEERNELNDCRLSKLNKGRKVRKGKVGGYKDEVSPELIDYMDGLLNKTSNKLLSKYR